MSITLLQTVHGSHLYGLSTPESDVDTYTVISNNIFKKKATFAHQSIIGDQDTFVADLSTFLKQCDEGVPQALEAMFSTQANVDHIKTFRRRYRPNVANAIKTYNRTIDNFLFRGDAKGRVHAVRLTLNLYDLVQSGRFDPTLGEGDQQTVMINSKTPESAAGFISLFKTIL